MRKNNKQISSFERRGRWLSLIALILTAIIIISAALSGCGKTDDKKAAEAASASAVAENEDADDGSGSGEAEGQDDDEAVAEQTGITFPYELDGGKLIVNSVFTADIINPDADNAEGTNIISLEVVNNSNTTLISGKFTVVLEDGTAVPFHAEYLPAGKTIWAFATDNALQEKPMVRDVTCETTYADTSLLMEDTFDISVSEMSVTLTNISGVDQNNITIYCHDRIEDSLYGGIVYTYPVDSLSAGETRIIEADDCWLGEAEIVGITVE